MPADPFRKPKSEYTTAELIDAYKATRELEAVACDLLEYRSGNFQLSSVRKALADKIAERAALEGLK